MGTFIFWLIAIVSILVLLAAAFGALFGLDETLKAERTASEQDDAKEDFGYKFKKGALNSLSYLMGEGVIAKASDTSYRSNWPIKPTGLNWRYFLWVSCVLLLTLVILPSLLPEGVIRVLYYCGISLYYLVSVLNFDREEVVESEDPQEVTGGAVDTQGGIGFDIVPKKWRPYVRIEERAIIEFFGTPICEVSGGQWFLLPMGFFSLKFFPKNFIQREIEIEQRFNAVKTLKGDKHEKDVADPLSLAQDSKIPLVFAFAIPRGYLAHFSGRVKSISGAVKILRDTAVSECSTICEPISIKEFSTNRTAINKKLKEACEKRVMEPGTKGAAPEDSLGLDILYVEIKNQRLSEVVTEAVNESAASPAELNTTLNAAKGIKATKEAEEAGELLAANGAWVERLRVLGYLGKDDKVLPRYRDEAMEILESMVRQQTLEDTEIKNFNFGSGLKELIENLIPGRTRQTTT